MTPVLQPLDRMINFPFKKYLKAKYSEFLLFDTSKEESLSEARQRIINDIADIWFKDSKDYNYINKDMAIKSFKITGISNKLDGTEDYLFDGYDVINNLTEKKETYSDTDSGYDTDKEKYKKEPIELDEHNFMNNKANNKIINNLKGEKNDENNIKENSEKKIRK